MRSWPTALHHVSCGRPHLIPSLPSSNAQAEAIERLEAELAAAKAIALRPQPHQQSEQQPPPRGLTGSAGETHSPPVPVRPLTPAPPVPAPPPPPDIAALLSEVRTQRDELVLQLHRNNGQTGSLLAALAQLATLAAAAPAPTPAPPPAPPAATAVEEARAPMATLVHSPRPQTHSPPRAASPASPRGEGRRTPAPIPPRKSAESPRHPAGLIVPTASRDASLLLRPGISSSSSGSSGAAAALPPPALRFARTSSSTGRALTEGAVSAVLPLERPRIEAAAREGSSSLGSSGAAAEVAPRRRGVAAGPALRVPLKAQTQAAPGPVEGQPSARAPLASARSTARAQAPAAWRG